MSMKSLLTILPESVETIVHQYNHQMKFKDVMDELKSRVEYCSCCDEYTVNLHNNCCEHCCEYICSICYKEITEYHDDIEEEILCVQCHIVEDALMDNDNDPSSLMVFDSISDEEVYYMNSLNFGRGDYY